MFTYPCALCDRATPSWSWTLTSGSRCASGIWIVSILVDLFTKQYAYDPFLVFKTHFRLFPHLNTLLFHLWSVSSNLWQLRAPPLLFIAGFSKISSSICILCTWACTRSYNLYSYQSCLLNLCEICWECPV